MVYKGCVIKVEDRFAVVLTTGAQYLKIIKKDGLILGKEILFVEEDLYREKVSNIKSFGLVAAVFILFFLSITLYNGLGQWLPLQQVAAVVSIDINPSLELEVNKENKVLRSVAINEEGKLLMDTSLKGLTIEAAVVKVVNKAKSLQYITAEKNTILISTVVLKEEAKVSQPQIEDAILEKIHEEDGLQELQVIYVRSKKEDMEKAREEKISIGKYEVYLEAKAEKREITVEQIRKAKVQELVNQGVGQLKVKEAVKKKSENEKEQKKEEIKKDSWDDKVRKPGKTNQENKKDEDEKGKDDKGQLKESPAVNKPVVDKKVPVKQEIKKPDKKDENTSGSIEKDEDKKSLGNQEAVVGNQKPEKGKPSKDDDSRQQDDEDKNKAKSLKKHKDLMNKFSPLKKPSQ
ncbi:hypothetical protein SAMN02745975_02821 [Geosporobacter subterraneus DSM 17957]|uniref:RsgI N-terminal anti-sigma domain-containing protein n=1 Tax=Geosporobacter subterraneus DSM 17957 TaxID=1121919 RepID=A0A1M6LZB1_9FIRM|nr:anti-sigma factor domain-containing protein [Geosporobacter subterraneus]SHJ76579.1 hypothetical protein SAMN02745975_02821 [Geosporobacter subterraneus DSM 17957]